MDKTALNVRLYHLLQRLEWRIMKQLLEKLIENALASTVIWVNIAHSAHHRK